MRRTLIALVAMAMLAAATSSGPSEFAAAASSGHSESQRAQHVKRFKLHTNTNHAFGPHNYVGTDVLKRHGRFVGYDSYSGFSDPTTKSVFRFALALKGGMIFGRVVQRAAGSTGDIVGPILGGSGRFAGIDGTAQLKFTTPQTLILRYRL
jgi:hypothetical protein